MKEKTGWIDKGTSDAGTVGGVVAGRGLHCVASGKRESMCLK